MEADSLNCRVLGPDAIPGTEEFDLYIKEVVKEMTIKAGQKLYASEIEQLLIDFIKSPQNYTCPHGRPLYILLDKHRLESMFLRK